MSAAATAAGYLFASGILDRRRQAKAEEQAQLVAPKPVAPRPVQVTYRKKRLP